MLETENRVDRSEKKLLVGLTHELQALDSTGEKSGPRIAQRATQEAVMMDRPQWGAKISTVAAVVPMEFDKNLEETNHLHFNVNKINPLFYGQANTTVMCDKAGKSVGFIHLPHPVVTWRWIALILFSAAMLVQFLAIQFLSDFASAVSPWWSFLSYPLMVILTPVFFKNEKTAVIYTSKKMQTPYCTLTLSSRFNPLLNTFKIEDKGEVIGWLTKNRLNGLLQCYAANHTLLFTARRMLIETESDKSIRVENKQELIQQSTLPLTLKIAHALKKIWYKLSNQEEANYVIKDDRGVKVGEFFSGQRCVLHIDEPFKKIRIDRRVVVPLALTMAGF